MWYKQLNKLRAIISQRHEIKTLKESLFPPIHCLPAHIIDHVLVYVWTHVDSSHVSYHSCASPCCLVWQSICLKYSIFYYYIKVSSLSVKMNAHWTRFWIHNHGLVSLMQVPHDLDAIIRASSSDLASGSGSSHGINGQENGANSQKLKRMPSKKLIANGLLLLGGLVCLSQGNSGLGAKVAIACVLKKLSKRGSLCGQKQQS